MLGNACNTLGSSIAWALIHSIGQNNNLQVLSVFSAITPLLMETPMYAWAHRRTCRRIYADAEKQKTKTNQTKQKHQTSLRTASKTSGVHEAPRCSGLRMGSRCPRTIQTVGPALHLMTSQRGHQLKRQ